MTKTLTLRISDLLKLFGDLGTLTILRWAFPFWFFHQVPDCVNQTFLLDHFRRLIDRVLYTRNRAGREERREGWREEGTMLVFPVTTGVSLLQNLMIVRGMVISHCYRWCSALLQTRFLSLNFMFVRFSPDMVSSWSSFTFRGRVGFALCDCYLPHTPLCFQRKILLLMDICISSGLGLLWKVLFMHPVFMLEFSFRCWKQLSVHENSC